MRITLQTAAPSARRSEGQDKQAEIAYVLKAFPRTSETFITNEIYLLETLGLSLSIFSVKRLDHQKLHRNVTRIQAPITYLPEAEPVNEGPFWRWLLETLPRFAASHRFLIRRRSLAYVATLAEALSMCWRYRTALFSLPRKVFFKEFLQAGFIAAEVLRNQSIRHLHAHFCHGATTITMFASRLSGLPFSFTAHAKDIYLKELNPGDLLSHKMSRAKFAVTCTGTNQRHLDAIRPKGAPLYTIYHGLDISLFTPPAAQKPQGKPLILSVGRFVEKKGFVYLVEACHLLCERGYRFECQIVGGRDGHFDVVERRVHELGLAGTVHLRAAVTQEELKEIYERATVFALPCLVMDNGDRDGIPNVLVEAMAMQIPVVATDVSGIPELVDPDVNGVLVPEKSPQALADAIAKLLDSSDLRRRLGEEARRKVRRLFDARENTGALRDLFTKALAESGSRCDCAVHPLVQPYSDRGPASLLSYFRSRANVRYFPVIADPAEVTRKKIDAILENRFEFNGETHAISPDFDWTQSPTGDTEWLILLHKFYYAVGLGSVYQETGDARYAHKWIELTDSWIGRVRPGFLSSDVTGRRIQNWIFAHYYFVTACLESPLPAAFYSRFLASLQAQVDWLRHHLTPARNHRTLELCAIFLASVVFPEMRGASEWLRFSTSELLENMRTDLLTDGVQCELSTDYHHIVLRNYLVMRRLAAMNRIALPAEMDAHIRRALEFAKWVHRPDGVIPSLSDGDSGSFLDLLIQGHELYADPEMLYVATAGRQGRAPAGRVRAFRASGYYILRSGWGQGDKYTDERYLIFDCGPLGAGNHGHFDLLHFEAYAYGRPLIVDPGRYTYHEGDSPNWRVLFRGTGYHNTVTIDGGNQVRYEFDKTRFKIRGPEPARELRSLFSGEEIDYVHGVCRSHEYDAVHERRIVFVRGEYWIVSDLLTASEEHDFDVWFHLSSEAQNRVAVSGDRVDAPFLAIAQPHGMQTVSLTAGFVSPTYGIKHPAPIVRLHRRARNTVFHTVLVPHRGAQPHVAVESFGDLQLRVTIRTGLQVFCDTLQFDSGNVSFKRQAAPPEREPSQELLTAR